MARRDPEAAALLAEVIAETADPVERAARAAYDPLTIYARLKKFYGCFTHSELEEMHYVTLFGYWRRAKRMAQEDRTAFDEMQARMPGMVPESELGGMFPQATVWDGG